MTTAGSDVTNQTNGKAESTSSPVALVKRFLELLTEGSVDDATDLLAEDVLYINVSLPAVRGRSRTRRVLRALMNLPGARLEIYVHEISADGGVVLTERTDALTFGPFRAQFWVCGRFDVRDGEIVVWKDYFDWLNATVAMLRGLGGILVPALRAKAPTTS